MHHALIQPSNSSLVIAPLAFFSIITIQRQFLFCFHEVLKCTFRFCVLLFQLRPWLHWYHRMFCLFIPVSPCMDSKGNNAFANHYRISLYFWSWLSIALSNVVILFSGWYFGQTKLNAISPATGATSPTKIVEGAIGGTITRVQFALCEAWVQKHTF